MCSRLRNARGSVLVLVAVAIFPIAAMMTFAIDASHWFDYSRNLQNRADAAALAGGDAYGNICFGGGIGDPWTGLQSSVGKWAQLYGGPGTGEPFDGGSNPGANVPYSDAEVSAATGVSPLGYKNVPNLTLGALSDYYMLLNANNYVTNGGTNFAMGDFCNADTSKDETDKNPGHTGGMVDVKLTQEQLPNFIPIFNVHPNITAHARVEIQQVQVEKGVKPIGVRDASFTPCVTANFLDNDNTIIASEKLKKPDPNGTLWTSVDDAKAVTMPAANPVSVELFLNDCSSTSPDGIKLDYVKLDKNGKSTTTISPYGLTYINNSGTFTAPGATGAPVIAPGGVTLSGSRETSCDPYFQSASTDCLIGVDAHVAFQPGLNLDTQVTVSALLDGKSNSALPLPHVSGTEFASSGTFFTIPQDSGPHTIDIQVQQKAGAVGGQTCTSNKPCTFTFANQQRTFAGTNGTNLCGPPAFDTGPLQWLTVSTTDGLTPPNGANSYGAGDAPHLFVRTSIVGLKNSAPGDPDICLRIAEQDSHATGFVDCGQGKGAKADQDAIVGGCPPVQKDIRFNLDGSAICTPAIAPPDCVDNDPGQSPPILKAFDKLIGGGSAPNCAQNPNWWGVAGHTITLADPRAMVMIITAPTDMAVAHGTANIPIRDFAVFYVTGWATGAGVVGCSNNDAEPGGGGPPGQDGKIWGHWTSIQVPSGLGTSNGEQCVFTSFGNCIAVLTR